MFSGLYSLIDSREIWWNAIIPYLIHLLNSLNILITRAVMYLLSAHIRILISLVFQIVLIFCGFQRKHVANVTLQYSVWVAYLAAEGIAISALSVLSAASKESSSDPSFITEMSWAPFVLLHLGGPDTISALALEDNELWLRHVVQLAQQLLAARLVVKSSWIGSSLNYVTIPIFIAGLIKYGERIWAQRLGSSENLRNSIIPPADPGPNYAKFMDEYTARKDEGYNVCLGDVIDTTPIIAYHSQGAIANDTIPDASAIHDGYTFFQIFKCLFADLSLSYQDREKSRNFFQHDKQTWEHAFKVTEVELELMYERLYTKSVITNSISGIVLKTVSFFCTLSAFITFCLLDKGQVDIDKIIITIVLFTAAILFEIYGFIVLLCSSWSMWRLSDIKNWKVDLLYWLITWYQRLFKLSHTKRWSNEMKQFNFISFCLKDKPFKCIQKLPFINKFLKKSYYQPSKTVPWELKRLIFYQLKLKSKDASDMKACKELCARRGDGVLQNFRVHENLDKEYYEIIDWSINGVEFDQSILLWHIATDLCCCEDEGSSSNNTKLQSCETSILLSNYMLYHLVVSPSMLPTGIGQTRFEDTLFEANELLQEREYISESVKACKMILRVNTEILPSLVKGDKNKSALFDACRLAKSLQDLVSKENWTNEKKWEMISYVWVEMLCHAACNCRGFLHAKQLCKGGELLTHVWLLMAHFGITEQFQMSKGHTRAKLLLS
ncbi:hypothetical protein TanjilG_03866 [Lupinus angustifolius]|uniref:DUF4220 domain-containing protein n=1 Tax=Lupinus angustifolius TaxID=3871 RepID=A0A4P1R4N4_LUPAN|nr:PREDICTED: uncharacterized protein LOC109359803 [Lupinus angustifolius]OIW01728.1 hypothetical protein TanjilG_03866 [Lupinus angustifolius]